MTSAINGRKGASIYDVCTEGEGVPSKADIVSNLSKGGCVNLRTRGGGVVQKSENFADVICVSPLTVPLCTTDADVLTEMGDVCLDP